MDTERRMTTQEMLTQHKKLMDEAQRLEPSVMVTERNWSALLEMQDRLFRQQMQLDADLKMLLTKREAQEALTGCRYDRTAMAEALQSDPALRSAPGMREDLSILTEELFTQA